MKYSAGDLGPPAYALNSVDKTLRIMHMLRDGMPLRISTVARNLDIAISTAHRMMAMLVFHGFAVQDEQRRYIPGPALGAPVLMSRDVDALLRVAAPVLEKLATKTAETVNLTLRVGPHSRVLLVAGSSDHTEMDRSGAVHPAHATAAGRASLAEVSSEQLEHLFRGPAAHRAGAALDKSGFKELTRELQRTRRRGYALSRSEAVKGIGAVAMQVASATTRTITLAVLTPSNKLDSLIEDAVKMQAIAEAARQLGAQLNLDD